MKMMPCSFLGCQFIFQINTQSSKKWYEECPSFNNGKQKWNWKGNDEDGDESEDATYLAGSEKACIFSRNMYICIF